METLKTACRWTCGLNLVGRVLRQKWSPRYYPGLHHVFGKSFWPRFLENGEPLVECEKGRVEKGVYTKRKGNLEFGPCEIKSNRCCQGPFWGETKGTLAKASEEVPQVFNHPKEGIRNPREKNGPSFRRRYKEVGS